jgi:hypothetical protein
MSEDACERKIANFRYQYLQRFQVFFMQTLVANYFSQQYCQKIVTVADFANCSQEVANLVKKECDKVRIALYKSLFSDLDKNSREECTALSLIVSSTTADHFHFEWQTRGAALYIYNRFLIGEKGSAFSNQLSRVPLHILQDWAAVLHIAFAPLVEKGLAKMTCIVAPLSAAIKIALRKQNTPPATIISTWCCDVETLIEHFLTLAQKMPLDKDRETLTRHVFRELLKLDRLSRWHKMGNTLDDELVMAAFNFIKSPALAGIRESVVRFSLHVEKEIIRINQFMPLTHDVEDFWRCSARQFIDAIDSSVAIFEFMQFKTQNEVLDYAKSAKNSVVLTEEGDENDRRVQLSKSVAQALINAVAEQKAEAKRARTDSYVASGSKSTTETPESSYGPEAQIVY